MARFAINTTVGVAWASSMWRPRAGAIPYALPPDFGITLALWGVPSGPFLYLPVLGPTNPRDATGYGDGCSGVRSAELMSARAPPLTALKTLTLGADRAYGRRHCGPTILTAPLPTVKKTALDPYATFRSLSQAALRQPGAIQATRDDKRATPARLGFPAAARVRFLASGSARARKTCASTPGACRDVARQSTRYIRREHDPDVYLNETQVSYALSRRHLLMLAGATRCVLATALPRTLWRAGRLQRRAIHARPTGNAIISIAQAAQTDDGTARAVCSETGHRPQRWMWTAMARFCARPLLPARPLRRSMQQYTVNCSTSVMQQRRHRSPSRRLCRTRRSPSMHGAEPAAATTRIVHTTDHPPRTSPSANVDWLVGQAQAAPPAGPRR